MISDFSLICHDCANSGMKSTVTMGHGSITTAYCPPFHDENGSLHTHDSNVSSTTYSCSNGHQWETKSTGGRWCGWPNNITEAETKSKSREIVVTRRKIEYYQEQVNLLEFLEKNVAEIYISHENKCIEIRFPTRVDNYTHYVGHIPLSCVPDVNSVNIDIKNERHMAVLEAHLNDIVMSSGFLDTVTR